MLTIIIILVSLCGLFYKYLTKNFDYWKKRNVIGPKPVILKGNLPSIWNNQVHQIYEFDKIYNDYKGEPFVGIFSVGTPKLFILDPELIKEVLIKNFKRFQDNEFADFVDKKTDPLFGRNPFVLRGEEWKEKRGEVTPAFTTSRIRALSALIDEVCGKMTDYLKQQSKSAVKTFDTRELTAKYTADVVSNCAFGVDAKSFEYEKSEIREMAKRLFELSRKFLLYVAAVSLFPFANKLLKVCIVPKDVNEFFESIMKNAIDYRIENKIERNDYLDHLMKMGSKKKVEAIDMVAHGVTFFIDGFETSSLAMARVLYDIANHKDVQDRLRAEIKDLSESSEGITHDNISELTYLEQVVNESMRLNPVLGVLTKKCTETTELTGKDKKVLVEKDTSVIIPIYSVHIDAEYYPDPLKFDPERFSPENGGLKQYKDNCVYLPFSDGPRMCLGMKFALAQMKRGIVEIMLNFEMTVNAKTLEPIRFDPAQFLLMPFGGFWLDFKPIN